MQRTVNNLLKEKGRDVWTVGPQATVYSAIEMMAAKDVGALLVVDGERVVGMLSERDYTRKIILQSRSSKATRVEEIMARPVYYVSPERTVEECMALMTRHRFRHLPVLEEGKLVGLISIGDVVKSVIEERGILIEQLERYIAGHS